MFKSGLAALVLCLAAPLFAQQEQPAAPAPVAAVPTAAQPGEAAVMPAAVPELTAVPTSDKAAPAALGGVPQALVSSNTANVVFAPVQDRDPMLSVQDVKDLEYERNKVKIEREKQLAAQRAARLAAQQRMDPEAIAKQMEKTIILQGIVGDQVIIQGKFYSAGQALPNGTKILRIDADSVSFRHGKRIFIKKVAQ